jgi:precorrin-2 dehydrogenase/sirohydrochlorin ferrochelatase
MMYPLFLNIQGRLCVVVGGGDVAARKVEALLECGADVRVVSPEAVPEIEAAARNGKITWLRQNFDESTLEGAYVAVAATDDEAVNRRACDACRAARILINVVDVPPLCDFHVPSVVRRGDVVIAIGTGGKAPAMSRRIRKRIQAAVGPEYGALLEIMGELRAGVQERFATPDDRKRVWERILDSDALAELAAGREPEARALIRDIIEQEAAE